MQTWPPAGMVMDRTWPWGLPPPGLRSSRTALWLSAYGTCYMSACTVQAEGSSFIAFCTRQTVHAAYSVTGCWLARQLYPPILILTSNRVNEWKEMRLQMLASGLEGQ